MTTIPSTSTSRGRTAAYWLTGIFLTLAFSGLHGIQWRGDFHLHTNMELIATLLAAFVGVMALIRFYSRKDNTFLFIGAGFLGTAFLDGYHTLVTSVAFQPFMPSDLPSLIPWSWVASRQFLAVMVFLSLLAWMREERLGMPGRVKERTVYVFSTIFTLFSFLFFAFVPLPTAYYPEIFFHRPEEFGPALFFLLGLIGYLKKGHWRYDTFEHWLVLSLIVGFISQAVFMSHSGRLFDYEFDLAHLLKKVSYICVLIGLLSNMFSNFRRAEEGEGQFRSAVESLQEGFALYDADDRLVIFNDEFTRLHSGIQDILEPGLPFENLLRANVQAGQISEAQGKEEEFIQERLSQHRNPQETLLLRQLTDGTWYIISEARTPGGGLAVTQTDITELKAAEEALRDSETRTRSIVDNVIDAIITIDERGIIHTVNPAAERIFGYSEKEMTGQNISFLAAEPYRSAHDRYLANYLTTGEKKIIGQVREVEGERRNGQRFPMELAVSEIRTGDERMFVGIVRDITQRKEMDRIKGEFISTVSHELRTPLTSIRGSLGLVTGGAAGKISDEAQELINLAGKNTERLIGLVNDILDMEKIESGSLEFRFGVVDLVNLVGLSIDANKGYADEYGVELVISEMPDNLKVRGDVDRLMQVMANLLSNAVKFSPKGGTVEITLSEQNGSAHVEISDHGAGIPEEFRDNVFSKFTQADASDTRKAGGTGLGLNISRTIINKHGGAIDFNTEEGKGSTFYFDLPLLDEKAGIASVLPASIQQGSRILICEDDKDVANLLSLMLKENGFLADVAHSAGQARELLAGRDYDAMTLDLILPDEDGISLLRSLRADEKTRDLPIIIVSAVADSRRHELQNGDSIGIVDWMVKPIDEKRLLSAVASSMPKGGNGHPRILYVEDDTDLITVVVRLLKDVADVVPAKTISEGREYLQQEHFDLVLLDVGMPDGSGIELLRFLRRKGDDKTPVIVFSADEVGPEIAAEVNATLVKSNTSNVQLLDIIRTCIEQRNN